MTRENVRLFAAGQYVITHRQETVDQKALNDFIDGALFAYDLITKSKDIKEEKMVARPPKMDASN